MSPTLLAKLLAYRRQYLVHGRWAYPSDIVTCFKTDLLIMRSFRRRQAERDAFYEDFALQVYESDLSYAKERIA